MKQLLAILLMGLCTGAAFAQTASDTPPSDEAIYEQLDKGGAAALAALKGVVKNADTMSAVTLYRASGAALKAKRLEDASFLFYIGQMRARFDTDAFPAKARGGDSPAPLLGALSSTLGQTINPAIMARPALFKQVTVRVEGWEPKTPPGYAPGWEYEKADTIATAQTAQNARKKKTVRIMRGLSALLSDPEYFKNFQLVQRYNGVAPGARPSPAEYEAATKRLKSIERAKKFVAP